MSRSRSKRKAKRSARPSPDAQRVTEPSADAPLADSALIALPRPLWRRAPLIFTLALSFLSLQVWLPLSYYLSDYPWDERFSWRMFSTVRSLTCQVRAWEGTTAPQGTPCPNGVGRCVPQRLSQSLHMVWVNLLNRGRREVVQALVKERCSRPTPKPFYLSLRCPSPEAPHPLITLQAPTQDLCAHPEAILPPLTSTMKEAHHE